MNILKQSTAATVVLGAFVDDTDGKTAETALGLVQADVRLSKNGGTFAQKNSATAPAHMEIGHYSCALDATDTNTLGRLRVAVHKTGALPVWRDFDIVPAMVWDSLVGGTDTLQADVTQWLGSAVTAGAIPAAAAGANGGLPTVNASNSVKIQTNLKKNQTLNAYTFLMTDSTNHNPATGLTVTATRSIDGGAFGAGTLGSVTEISAGTYKIDLPAADLNGNIVALRFTASGADDLIVTLVTEP